MNTPRLLRHAALAASLMSTPALVAVAQPFQLPPENKPAGRPGASATSSTTPSGDPRIEGCQIDLIEDVALPASDAGPLTHLAVKVGDQVRAEDVIARVDDREPKQQQRRAQYALAAAVKRAKNRVPEEFAEAQLEVAVETLKELEDTNARLEKAVPEADIRQARAEVKSGKLRIKNAEQDRRLAEDDAWTARVDVETAKMLIDRREILAPFDGEVIELFKKQSEWVSPGDPILRLVRLDTLKVEGLISANQYSPAELDGCEVTVQVPIARGRVVEATGRVTWVDPVLMRFVDGAVQKVRAEISNRRENGYWLIQSKREATMTIHLGTGGVAAAQR